MSLNSQKNRDALKYVIFTYTCECYVSVTQVNRGGPGQGAAGKPRAASVFSSKSSVSAYRPPVGVPVTSPITSPDTARTYLYQGLIGKQQCL